MGLLTKKKLTPVERPKRMSAALYGNSPRIREKQDHLTRRHVGMMFGFQMPEVAEKKKPKAKYSFIDRLGKKITVYGS